MRKRTREPSRWRIAAGLLLLGAAQALAQQGSVVNLKKVEVTGTRIARIDGESGLPVQVITREELLDAGVQTMQDLLDRVNANMAFGDFNEAKGEAVRWSASLRPRCAVYAISARWC